MSMAYSTIRLRVEDGVGFLQLHRPEAGNAINDRLVTELAQALDALEHEVGVIVLEGQPEVFCAGADFAEIQAAQVGPAQAKPAQDPQPLYALWRRLALGPCISLAHVRGRANAGGVGFVSACDIVLADHSASFGLSELLFGLMPACVLPFLIRRVGPARANFMTLSTQPIQATQARDWGLVDACEDNSEALLRRQLRRLRCLDRGAIARYKRYAAELDSLIDRARAPALAANHEVFSDRANLAGISRYVETGRFPWETH